MTPDRPILAFDTSAAHCAAALVSGDRVLAEVHEDMSRGQAERLMPLLEELLEAHGLTWRDLERIGVGIGPGNFTGIRISVSAARGLALALGIPAIGVSTLEAQAFGLDGPVISTLDARRGGIYLQAFDHANRPAVLAAMEDLPTLSLTLPPRCTGFCADDIAAHYGGKATPPAVPLSIAIGHIAGARDPAAAPRPAPLYLRGADAAPPRTAAPQILQGS